MGRGEEDTKKTPWWQTVPALLTAMAALLGALTGLVKLWPESTPGGPAVATAAILNPYDPITGPVTPEVPWGTNWEPYLASYPACFLHYYHHHCYTDLPTCYTEHDEWERDTGATSACWDFRVR